MKIFFSVKIGLINTYEIPVKELKIKKKQTYVLYGKGISLINTKNNYNIKKKGNVIFNITILL